MATINTTLSFSLPEDVDSDTLRVYSASAKTGTYSLDQTFDYEYGTRKQELELDDQTWYKIRFYNSEEEIEGPESEPVYGGDYDQASPFLAVSTMTDGANYASVTDVYEYSGLAPQDVSQEQISNALRRARAVIDYRTAEMGLDRFAVFSTDVARRKYNASLRMIKEAEINMALGTVYQNLTDDIIIEARRSTETVGGVSIGGTSIGGDTLATRTENIMFLAALSDRYFGTAAMLLSSIDTNSVRLVSEYTARFPRFQHPGRYRSY